MIPAMMKALLLGSMTLSLQAAASSAPKVVKMPIGQKANSHILRKRDPFAVCESLLDIFLDIALDMRPREQQREG